MDQGSAGRDVTGRERPEQAWGGDEGVQGRRLSAKTCSRILEFRGRNSNFRAFLKRFEITGMILI